MANPVKEVCTMRVIFPVQSDEQALDCKKKVQEALKGIDNLQSQFEIMSVPLLNARTKE